MPNSGTRPRRSRTVVDGPVELGRIAGAVADQHRCRLQGQHCVGVPRARDDHRLDARLDEPARRSSACSRGRGRRRGGRRPPSTARRCTLRAPARVRRAQAPRASAASRGAAAPGLARATRRRTRYRARSASHRRRAGAGRARACRSPRAPRLRAPRARTPTRAGAAHDDALRPDAIRLEQALVDAVVPDQRIGERQHLPRVARVGDRLLVAGRRGREAGLAGGDAGGADRPAGEDRSVLEDELRKHLRILTTFSA